MTLVMKCNRLVLVTPVLPTSMNQSLHVHFTVTHLFCNCNRPVAQDSPHTVTHWSVGLSVLSPSLVTLTLCLQTERDVSVRQRAADLLYAMCDRSNAKQIVAEMLSYLETADYSIREEMVGVTELMPCYILFFIL